MLSSRLHITGAPLSEHTIIYDPFHCNGFKAFNRCIIHTDRPTKSFVRNVKSNLQLLSKTLACFENCYHFRRNKPSAGKRRTNSFTNGYHQTTPLTAIAPQTNVFLPPLYVSLTKLCIRSSSRSMVMRTVDLTSATPRASGS